MSVNALKELGTLGQSLWLDYIRRESDCKRKNSDV